VAARNGRADGALGRLRPDAPTPVRRLLATVLAGLLVAGCGTSVPAPPASATVAPGSPTTLEPLAPSASVTVAPESPTTPEPGVEIRPPKLVPLPDDLNEVAWVGVSHENVGEEVSSTVTAGLLGGGATLVIQPPLASDLIFLRAAGELVALGNAVEDRTQIRRVRDGQILGTVPSMLVLALDAERGFVYWDELVELGVGRRLHRSRLDGSEDTVLVELGPDYAQDGPYNGVDMYGATIGPHGTFIAEVCSTADGCRLELAAPGDDSTRRVPVDEGPSLCNIIGATSRLLVVYDSETCFADFGEAPTPVAVIDIASGERQQLHDGPWFGAVRVQERNGVAEVLVHRPVAGALGNTVRLVDLESGRERVLFEPVPAVQVDGERVALVPSRLPLPPDWILLVPEPLMDSLVPGPPDLPPSQLINIRDNRWIELPSVPGMGGIARF